MVANLGTTADMHEFHLSKSTINYDMNDDLQFQNDILMEIFDDQKNVMEFRIDKKRYKDFLLKKSDSKASVDLR